MSFPRPVFDHLVINASERVDEAEAIYRGLGFTLTPRGHHSLGSVNHCAMFPRDYLEIVGVPRDGAVRRAELLRFPEGLNGIVFATDDAPLLYKTLVAAGAPVEAPLEFSRPVILDDGPHEARFRVVRVAAEAARYGRVYFCEHLTRGLVWREAWLRHANSACGILRAVLLASDPNRTAALYRRLFGATAVTPVAGGFSLAAGEARLDIVTRAWGAEALDEDRLLGLALRTRGKPRLVPPAGAFGLYLELVA